MSSLLKATCAFCRFGAQQVPPKRKVSYVGAHSSPSLCCFVDCSSSLSLPANFFFLFFFGSFSFLFVCSPHLPAFLPSSTPRHTHTHAHTKCTQSTRDAGRRWPCARCVQGAWSGPGQCLARSSGTTAIRPPKRCGQSIQDPPHHLLLRNEPQSGRYARVQVKCNDASAI